MLTKTREIKYMDEVDYILDGLVNNEIFESLSLINKLLEAEEFKIFMSESRHLHEIIQILLDKEIKELAICMMVLETIFQCFNPYSFVDLSDLFGILLIVFNSLLLNNLAEDLVNIRTGTKKIERILGRIPVKWYRTYSKCLELERLMFGLQICFGRKILKYNGLVCSVLKILPGFELEDTFIIRLLESRENYEILINYTASEENVRKLAFNSEFKPVLENIVLREFAKQIDDYEPYKDTDIPVNLMQISSSAFTSPLTLEFEHKTAEAKSATQMASLANPARPMAGSQDSTDRCLDRDLQRTLVIILINLIDRDYFINVPVSIMEETYYVADKITRCYLAVFFLMFIKTCKKDITLGICMDDLRKEVMQLISISSSTLSESTLAKLAKLAEEQPTI